MKIRWYHDDFPAKTSRKYVRTNQPGSIQQSRTSETRSYTNLTSKTMRSDRRSHCLGYQLRMITALWLSWKEMTGTAGHNEQWISRAPKAAMKSTNLFSVATLVVKSALIGWLIIMISHHESQLTWLSSPLFLSTVYYILLQMVTTIDITKHKTPKIEHQWVTPFSHGIHHCPSIK